MNDFLFWQDLWGLHCQECEELWDTQKSASSFASQTTDSSTEEDVFLQALKEEEYQLKECLNCQKQCIIMLWFYLSTVLT